MSPLAAIAEHLKWCQKKPMYITTTQSPRNSSAELLALEGIPRLIISFENNLLTSASTPLSPSSQIFTLDLNTAQGLRYYNKTITLYTRKFSTTVHSSYALSESLT